MAENPNLKIKEPVTERIHLYQVPLLAPLLPAGRAGVHG